MFNDEGLGQAMSEAYQRDRTQALERRVADLERQVQQLLEFAQRFQSVQPAMSPLGGPRHF
jgi:polyhydroxyalkanoate synthesis regulator phasin